jgi:hypothetical protein
MLTEILAHILCLHLTTTLEGPRHKGEADRLAPIGVCQHWRQAALNYTKCWTKLTVSWEVRGGWDHHPRWIWLILQSRMTRQFSLAQVHPIDLFILPRACAPDPALSYKYLRDSGWVDLSTSISSYLKQFSNKLRLYAEEHCSIALNFFHGGCTYNNLSSLRVGYIPSAAFRSTSPRCERCTSVLYSLKSNI